MYLGNLFENFIGYLTDLVICIKYHSDSQIWICVRICFCIVCGFQNLDLDLVVRLNWKKKSYVFSKDPSRAILSSWKGLKIYTSI